MLGVALAGPTSAAPGVVAVFHPTVAEDYQMTSSTAPPTSAQCISVGRTCFTPQAVQSAYNLAPLYSARHDARAVTISLVYSYCSDTIAHALHAYDEAF